MPLRMLRYYTDIQLAYPGERIYQYLVYIGKPALRMAAEFNAGDFSYRYHILDMHTVDCNILIRQDTPDALVLAILCDFKERPTQDVVNYIIRRLHELLQEDERGFRDYFEMLETLSDNRQLQANIDKAKEMLTQIDIEKLPSYRWGKIEGKEEGREEGKRQERKRLARQLLTVMDDQTIATMTQLPLDEIKQLRKSLL